MQCNARLASKPSGPAGGRVMAALLRVRENHPGGLPHFAPAYGERQKKGSKDSDCLSARQAGHGISSRQIYSTRAYGNGSSRRASCYPRAYGIVNSRPGCQADNAGIYCAGCCGKLSRDYFELLPMLRNCAIKFPKFPSVTNPQYPNT